MSKSIFDLAMVTNVEVRATTYAVLSPTWSLSDVCGSSDILLAAHHKRTTTVLSLRGSGGCLPIGSDR